MQHGGSKNVHRKALLSRLRGPGGFRCRCCYYRKHRHGLKDRIINRALRRTHSEEV